MYSRLGHAMIMVENEKCSGRPVTSEEIKTKASDRDKLTEQMREKLTLGSTTCEEKINILTLTPQSWSIVKAASFFGVSEYLIRQARELKKSCGILGSPDKYRGKPLPASTTERVQLFFEDDAHSRLMPGKKDFISIKKNVHKQMRLLLCNLHELYVLFKEQNPELKIGFSKFCLPRPKWCVAAGSGGTHSVCVCTIHQNAKLLVNATKTGLTYKELMNVIVFDCDNKTCIVHRCNKCLGTDSLREYLETLLDGHEDVHVTFQQWQTTDRSMMVTQTLNVDEFIELLVGAIDNLTSHSYIAECQTNYLKRRKEELPDNCALVLGDFAEKYTFVVQDEIQSFHWSKLYCTLHPIVVYYKENGKLSEKSFCFISDDQEHNTEFVFELQGELVKILKEILPTITEVQYFSDGCAAQYKN